MNFVQNVGILKTLAILFVQCLILGSGALNERNDRQSITKHNSREPRALFKKLHSGAAFLAGIKVGSYLSSKGLTAGAGSLATSHTFQIFGKSVSTALSLSYGGTAIPLPLSDPIDNSSLSRRPPEENVVITIIENPSDEIVQKLKEIAKVTENMNHVTEMSTLKIGNATGKSEFNKFVENHNRYVNKLNADKFGNKTRINSRF